MSYVDRNCILRMFHHITREHSGAEDQNLALLTCFLFFFPAVVWLDRKTLDQNLALLTFFLVFEVCDHFFHVTF